MAEIRPISKFYVEQLKLIASETDNMLDISDLKNRRGWSRLRDAVEAINDFLTFVDSYDMVDEDSFP